MAGTRNDSERLRMRVGMGIYMGMNGVLMAALDEEAYIIYIVCYG